MDEKIALMPLSQSPSTTQRYAKNIAEDPVKDIKDWFDTLAPEPSNKDAHLQISDHIKEFRKTLFALKSCARTFRMSEQVGLAIDVLEFLERQIKALDPNDNFLLEDLPRVDMIDTLMNQMVSTVGLAHMLEMDPVKSFKEVVSSYPEKFDETGSPIFDQTRKLVDNPRYRYPDLTPYV